MQLSQKPLNMAIGLLATSLALTTSANAADTPDRSFPQRIYLGGSIGVSQLEPKTAETGYHVDDDSGTGGTLTLGYDLNKHLSVEGFVSTMGEAEIADDTSGTHAGEIDYGYAGISAIGYLYNSRTEADYPGFGSGEGYYRREGLSLFARVGAGKLDTSSSNLVHRQNKDWDLHLGAGLEYGWSSGFAARVEFASFDKDAKLVSIGIIKRFGDSSPPVAPPAIIAKPEQPQAVSKPTPPAPPKTSVTSPPVTSIELPVVLFPYNRADLTPDARRKLNTVADTLSGNTSLKLEVSGHTDAIGSERYNEALGQRRADSAARYLIENGIDAKRLEPVSYGERKPVADNATAAGRQQNRRVAFEIK